MSAAGKIAAPLPIQLLRITDIVPDPKNRKDHDKAELALLAESIKADGLLQPIVVRPTEKAGKFMLVAGERRWLAHQILKRETIEARVTQGDSYLVSTRKRLAENFHREDLSPIQKAEALQQLFDQKMNQSEIAAFVGAKDASTVSNFMRLLRLPQSVKAMVHDGRLSRAHGVALCRFEKYPKLVEKIAVLASEAGTPSKALEKGLPFGEKLAAAKLVTDVSSQTGYEVARLKELPAAYEKDPEFMESSNEYDEVALYCIDTVKGKKLVDEVEAAEEAEAQKQKAKSGTTSGAAAPAGSKLKPAEIAARRKKIADNKANRVKATAQLTTSIAKLAGTKKVEKNLLVLLVGKVLVDHHYRTQVKAAAEKMGLLLPAGLVKSSSWYGDEVKVDKISLLSEADMLRLAAGAVVLYHGECAVKFAQGECAETTLVAGQYKAPVGVKVGAIIAVGVKISGNPGSGFKATAGLTTVSSTSSATQAAKEAAARHMGCQVSDVELTPIKDNRCVARLKSAKGKARK